MEALLRLENLSVGYNGDTLIKDIHLGLERGNILTLIGPNGGGKSTILKTISRQIPATGGKVYLNGSDIFSWTPGRTARKMSSVLTDRPRPELMTCGELVALGRTPHTNIFGKLTARDIAAIEDALKLVNALELADKEFSTLSDGQRQRVMLARAICQEPELMILDEPTAYLDIRHKLELLDILRRMSRERGLTVVMSLHEIDLAAKISDRLLCVKEGEIAAFGTPEEIMQSSVIEKLYGLPEGAYNLHFGSVELPKVGGGPRIFVIAGGGLGIPHYRILQRRGISFAAGILFENDIDFQVASALSSHVVSTPAFEPMDRGQFERALELIKSCGAVLDAGTPVGEFNRLNSELLSTARALGIPVYTDWSESGKGPK